MAQPIRRKPELLYGLSLYGAGGIVTLLLPVQSYRELLPEALMELWEERAAIMEYEGGLSREDAEWQAFLCVQGDVYPE